MKGLTIAEMAEKLDLPYWTVKQRLLRAGIKPITKEAIFPETALEDIKIVKSVGRPKKQPEKKKRK